MLASRKKSTTSQYNVHITRWLQYCEQNDISPYYSSIIEGINFLAHCFEQGLGYSSINTARCALSSIMVHPMNTDTTFGSHPLVQRFMKGVFNQRPSLPRYSSTWDTSIVLNYLDNKPLSGVTLKDLTLKCLMLLALLTGHRLQTLKAISINNIVFTTEGCEIYLSQLLKTTRPGKHILPIKLQSYSTENLCVVLHLKKYLLMTEPTRHGDQLFVSFHKPYSAVSTDTLSRWIKSVLTAAGIDTTIFRAHSTRSASTSKVSSISGISVDIIMAAAGWANSQTFAKFYHKPLHEKTFGSLLLDQKDL